jgi:hypothetical protein
MTVIVRMIQMNDKEIILNELLDALGEEGWKMMLEGFMEPWKLGRTVAEAKAGIREYAKMGFGLS